MSKKERIEDLGRIYQILERATGCELFDKCPGRNKDFLSYWSTLSKEQHDKFLHYLPYEIEEVRDFVLQSLEIARGEDE